MASQAVDTIDYNSGSGSFFAIPSKGGNSGFISTVDPPERNFDISPLTGLKPSDKYRGNRVSEIYEALESYRLNTSVGRGGQYAQDVVTKYGAADIRAGAASYLQAVGLNYLADVVSPTPDPTPTPNPTPDPTPTPNPTPVPDNPFKLLLDALPNLFGQQVYNPPLQSQTYGYTPEQSFDSGSGGISIMPILLFVVIAAVGYFLYKRYA